MMQTRAQGEKGMRIYVASSWRNEHQPEVVKMLRAVGHDVYDFHNPEEDNHGFHWSEIDENWQSWTPEQFIKSLDHEIARHGFYLDQKALKAAHAGILVMPAGRSAHLEAGWLLGSGKPVIIYLTEKCEPELMYGLARPFLPVTSLSDVVRACQIISSSAPTGSRS